MFNLKNSSALGLLILLIVANICVATGELKEIKSISDEEAAAIVHKAEKEKKARREALEKRLNSANIVETAVADLGDRKVIFNRVVQPQLVEVGQARDESLQSIDQFPLSSVPFGPQKEYVNMHLSGSVFDGLITELWWTQNGERYSIFVNADLSCLSGNLSFEEDEAIYSAFILAIINSAPALQEDKWQPTIDDFSEGSIEYFITEWGSGDSVDFDDFKGVDALLRYFIENETTLKTRQENSRKIAEAKEEYLKANPPGPKRDTIINFRPLE